MPLRFPARRGLLALSLALNAMLLAATVYFIHDKGGVQWIKHKFGIQSVATVPRITGDPSWQNRKSVFEAQPIHPHAIIFAGDSMTDFCPWDEMLPGKGILNRGLPGDYIEGVTLRLDEILRHSPSQLFVMAGINDLEEKKSLQIVMSTQPSNAKMMD